MSPLTRNTVIVIILSFLIRLTGITNPPLEKSHNWRQSFTAMVARNFDHTDILNPEVDIQGGQKIAMEFPLFSYLIYIFNSLFGYAHWYGRLINLFVSTIGLWFFYKLIRRMFSEQHAFYSTVLLTFSIFFSFSRKIMPDTFSVSLTIVGIYYFIDYLSNNGRSLLSLLGGMILVSAGLLSKIPSITLLAFLVPAFIDKRYQLKTKLYILFAGLLPAGLLSYYWYGMAVPASLQSGALALYFPVEFIRGLTLLKEHISGVLEKFYFSAFFSFIAFTLFLTGLLFIFLKKQMPAIILFIVSSVMFFFFMIKASNFFYYHNYYIIPFVPVMAVVAGYGVRIIFEKNRVIAHAILLFSTIEGILNQQHGFFDPPDMKYRLQLTSIADKFISVSDKVILNSGPNPQSLYFCNRKGWVIDENEYITKQMVDSISAFQNPFVIVDRHSKTNYAGEDFNIIFKNEDYILLREKIN